jgi:hypothetical protein
MRHGPHFDDWRPGNPDIHPGRWFAGFFLAGLGFFAVLGLFGSMINGI